MAIDTDALQKLLCERLCEEVHMTKRPDGAMMLRTHFEFLDRDRFPIHVLELGGRWIAPFRPGPYAHAHQLRSRHRFVPGRHPWPAHRANHGRDRP